MMTAQHSLSDAEYLNLNNRVYTLREDEVKDAEFHYSVSLDRPKKVELGGIGAGLSSIGFVLIGGTLMYACSSLLSGMGFFEATFHTEIDHAWSHLKNESIPSFFHHLFLFLKGAALGAMGIGVYKTVRTCVDNTKTPPSPVVKINGKEVV